MNNCQQCKIQISTRAICCRSCAAKQRSSSFVEGGDPWNAGFQKGHGFIGGGVPKGTPSSKKGKGRAFPVCLDCNKILGDHRSIKCRKCASFKKGTAKKLTEEHKQKIRIGMLKADLPSRGKHSSYRGEKHWNWKGGMVSPKELIRKSLEYKLWRESVLTRDEYTCQECKLVSSPGNFILMHVDHIKPFALFPELRLAIDNGRTLCVPCHKKTPSYLNPKIKREDFVC